MFLGGPLVDPLGSPSGPIEPHVAPMGPMEPASRLAGQPAASRRPATGRPVNRVGEGGEVQAELRIKSRDSINSENSPSNWDSY